MHRRRCSWVVEAQLSDAGWAGAARDARLLMNCPPATQLTLLFTCSNNPPPRARQQWVKMPPTQQHGAQIMTGGYKIHTAYSCYTMFLCLTRVLGT